MLISRAKRDSRPGRHLGPIVLLVLGTVACMLINPSSLFIDLLYKLARQPPLGTPAQLGLQYEDVEFSPRGENIELQGWYMPAERSHRVVVILHGGFANRTDKWANAMLVAKVLIQNGFNVLTFDQRANGRSGGNRFGLGYWEWKDVLGALDYLKTRGFRPEEIGFLGYSTGGAAAIMAAANDTEVTAIVSDSTYADLKDMLKHNFDRFTHLPEGIFLTLLHVGEATAGIPFSEASPEALVSRVGPRHILFIHGEKDEIVPLAHAYRLFRSANNPENELWIVANAGHVQSFNTEPNEFTAKVVGFLSKELR